MWSEGEVINHLHQVFFGVFSFFSFFRMTPKVCVLSSIIVDLSEKSLSTLSRENLFTQLFFVYFNFFFDFLSIAQHSQTAGPMKDRREQGKNHTICEKQKTKEKTGRKDAFLPPSYLANYQRASHKKFTRNFPQNIHTHEETHTNKWLEISWNEWINVCSIVCPLAWSVCHFYFVTHNAMQCYFKSYPISFYLYFVILYMNRHFLALRIEQKQKNNDWRKRKQQQPLTSFK